jgi:2-methylisocitrate lyase-like PEP mutase family enzyme
MTDGDDGAQQKKAAAFRALHQDGCFLIPNPWDAGSARVLEALGFPALATTSSGFAFTLGRRDGGATLDDVCEHARRITEVTHIPLSVDLENGYARDSTAVGASIEDYDGEGAIYELPLAVERVAAAVEAARALHFPFTLTARAENLIRGRDDLDDTVRRLQAYAEAGADVLFAPGLRTLDDMRTVCNAVGRPVNVLAVPSLRFSEIAATGARRVSVGGRLTWVAVRAMAEAATALRDGDLSVLDAQLPLDDWFR